MGGLALALVACGPTAKPPPAPPPPNPTDAALPAMFNDSAATGMVVAVAQGDQVTVRGFGRRGVNDPTPPDGRTLVRLESISKLFASELLASMVAEGRVKLSDPLALYAPKGWRAPTTKGALPITLLNLATHTSGLPREAGIKPAPPAGQIVAARWAWVARQRRLPPPGLSASYSNIGFDLLSDALAEAANRPYTDALKTTVTVPLGLVDTTTQPTPEQCARMLASDPARHPFPCVDQTTEAGSGGLYSTADDMGRWLKSQLAAAPDARTKIGQGVYVQRSALKAAVGLDHAGPANAIGLAWIELAAAPGRPRVLEKTGGGDGFLTYVVIDPAHRVGVFLAFDNESGHRLPLVTADANALVAQLASATP